MLLTIHNLPSHMRYVDIKALLQSKCGLSEVILDNLVNEGANKKVTVGLVEEEDAAIVVRHINGLVMDGQMLYVEDVRQKKASEQPYWSSNMMSNQGNQNMNNPWQTGPPQGYGFGMGFPNPLMQMDSSGMMMPPMMNGYFMPQNNYMDYNNQQPTNMSQGSQPMEKGGNSQQESRDYQNRGSNKNDDENRSQIWRREGDYNSYRQDQPQYDEPGRSRQNNNNEVSRERYRSRSPRNDNRRNDNPRNDNRRNDNPRNDYPGNNNYRNDNSRDSRSDYSRNNNSRNDNPRFVSPQNDNLRGGWASSNKYENSNTRSDNYDRRRENSANNYPNTQRDSANKGYSDRNPNKNNPGRWSQQERPQFEKGQDDRRFQPNTASAYKVDRRQNPKAQEAPRDQQFQQKKHFPNPITKNTPQNSRWGRMESDNAPLPTSKPTSSITKKPTTPQATIPTSFEVLVRKYDTWKHQAAAKIKKDILTKFGYVNDDAKTYDIGKAVKLAIRTRLELILKGKTVNLNAMEPKYREVFPESNDKEFFEGILENLRIEQLEKEKQPKQEETVTTSAGEPAQATAVKNPAPVSNPPAVAQKPQLAKFVIPKTKNAPKPKPQANEPPPQPVPVLPKYPFASKKAYTEQKQLQKLEFQDDNLYQLDPPLTKALNEQLDKFCELFAKELQNPVDEREELIFSKLRSESVDYFRRSLRVNITRRLLDIRTNLIVRVFIDGKIAKKAHVCEFMKKFGVISMKKSEGKKLLYIANLSKYEDYDHLLKMGHARMSPETMLSFKPFQLTGPKHKLKKKGRAEQRAAYLKNQEEFMSAGGIKAANENLDFTGSYDDQQPDDEDFENDDDEALSEDNIDNVDDFETKYEAYDEDFAEDDFETKQDLDDIDMQTDEIQYKGEMYEVKDEDLEDY